MTMKKISALVSLFLLAVLFVMLVYLNNQLLSRHRVDLTEDSVFSLSQGTRNVLEGLNEPVTLYFFFSDTTTTGKTRLRNYANRVQSLLREYAQASAGKVKLQVVDPIPFSENEDRANQFGLTSAAVGNAGESVYFGLAGTNLLDDQFAIPFFDEKNARRRLSLGAVGREGPGMQASRLAQRPRRQCGADHGLAVRQPRPQEAAVAGGSHAPVPEPLMPSTFTASAVSCSYYLSGSGRFASGPAPRPARPPSLSCGAPH